MEFSIGSLKTLGAFTGAPVEREITWASGEDTHTATVYVRRLSYKSAIGDIEAARDKLDPIAVRIAASICDSAGVPIFKPGDITGDADPDRGPLDAALTWALLAVITEVNALGKPQT